MAKPDIWFEDLGRREYGEAWKLQEALLCEGVDRKTRRRNAEAGDLNIRNYLLFVEHPPVYTLGKSGHEENVLLSEAEMTRRGIAYFHTNRGGDITFHGPEQIVGYPILDLEQFTTDIGLYLRNLEEVIIRTLARYGVRGERSPGETGVWIEPTVQGRARKIAALGVRCSRWITMHGFAFNINTDLGYFDHIVPCGIRDKKVTSLQAELGHPVNLPEVKEELKKQFAAVFAARLIQVVSV